MKLPIPITGLALSSLLCAGLASAQPLYIAWNDCAGAPLASQRALFECDRNTGVVMPVVVSFIAPENVDAFVGLTTTIEIRPQTSSDVPDWWHLEAGGCRSGALGPSIEDIADLSGHCSNPFLSSPTAVLSFVRLDPDRVIRVIADGAIASTNTSSLQAGALYTAHVFNLYVMRTTNQGGGIACDGCGVNASISVTGVDLSQLTPPLIRLRPQGPPPTITYVGADVPGTTVPVARSTWGGIKALYR